MLDWFAAHWTEVFGFVSGAASVILAAVRSVWNFPVGIANNLVFIVLFATSALYADAGLQLVFIVLAIAGWVGWLRGKAVDDRAATVRTPRRAIPWLIGAGVVLTAGLTLLLTVATNSTTQFADAATTSGSLVAQFMLNSRWIENWFVWIAVDVGYVALYAVKGLWITAALYLLFIVMCVLGLRAWRRAPHEVAAAGSERAAEPAAGAARAAGEA